MSHPDAVDLFRSLSRPLTPRPTGELPALDTLRLNPPAAVFLDVYGTMVLSAAGEIAKDAESAAARDPVRDALRAEGLDPIDLTWEDLLAGIRREHARAADRGVPHPEVDIRSIWREALTTRGAPADDPLTERLATRCELAANPCWPEPTLGATLAALREAGVILGIISNAQFYTRAMIEAFLGRPPVAAGFHPDLLVWSFEERIAKPDPRLFQFAADRLAIATGLSPHDVVMVGNDVRNDIAPAAATGFRTALYAGDARSLRRRPDDPAPARPDAVITSLSQLIQ